MDPQIVAGELAKILLQINNHTIPLRGIPNALGKGLYEIPSDTANLLKKHILEYVSKKPPTEEDEKKWNYFLDQLTIARDIIIYSSSSHVSIYASKLEEAGSIAREILESIHGACK